ncbi:MAG: IS110 family transposase [Desulfobacula sp.]|jgi:transposase|uniref:IS110 family transposase n=2 Tax=Desulfobacula sp. TaxID=2593537 RepID=UPI001D457C6E|nr:IS110 family transposase [Desulfobacula sp.]MBT3486477.1 IS110 family transposase [Desulfobacula sp.]MBT3806786.1 IS110 family transposase [Desulfobacula sp.]MBT4027081.1 IS110 family transposase [Desulfobacula sp.]MBT4197881.1 IS110 family transposase [Desulfobacula sp.]
MTKKLDTTFIQIVHPVCCGLDVHKKKISACLIIIDEHGKEQYEVKEFGTFTNDLLEMKKWLTDNSCPVLAMESTGVYWRPVHNVIEGFMEVILVNARHIKNVPGRKTDISDCKWLAGLLRHGLLKGSFIPPKEIRQWRELTRLRRTYTESRADYKRRVHKLFETANIKIDSVVSDLFGVTGRNLIFLLCNESELSLDAIKENAKRGLKAKSKELHSSIHGFFEDHHRFQLIGMMEMIATFEKRITEITQRMDTLTEKHQDLLNRLDEIPGIDKKSAQSIVSELGITLDEFTCMAALASWAGLCPGNNESAGKRKSGRTSVRSHPFKTILVEVAWAAVKKKGSYYRAKYYKLKARRGAKKAIVAIAHRISKAIFNIIKQGDTFMDLGEDYLTVQTRQRVINNIKKQAEQLGYKLVPCEN